MDGEANTRPDGGNGASGRLCKSVWNRKGITMASTIKMTTAAVDAVATTTTAAAAAVAAAAVTTTTTAAAAAAAAAATTTTTTTNYYYYYHYDEILALTQMCRITSSIGLGNTLLFLVCGGGVKYPLFESAFT